MAPFGQVSLRFVGSYCGRSCGGPIASGGPPGRGAIEGSDERGHSRGGVWPDLPQR